ncbi:hypothetical protein BUALT_Bualt02G0175200 [Buddleja alternifolia]|uniref:Helicase ATP-binding domain-containing protein n=1 Tax=Buddleja alternifolia TaxID=168488 RepID=A0AAV6Y349_9LAMI|nr:hypothetical protein BUALT_Bualt02G0175200 [Buddleja alternifolia]
MKEPQILSLSLSLSHTHTRPNTVGACCEMEDSASPLNPSPTPLTNPNPNSNHNPRNTIHIGGIPVEFPYQPYGTQLAFMNRVISTLDRSQKDGHCHALLESPTGTGKSLSLLCSALAWQQNQKLKNIHANLTHSSSRPNPEAVTDPINHGGGFIPETQPSGNPVPPPPATTNAKKEKPRLAPTIFYSSRTHTQISQVTREYRKTSYRVPMAILGSRKHYCTNTYLRGEDNVDEQCKLLLKNREDSCPEFKNVHKVKGHPSLQKGGCHEVHDIEDLVKIGQVVKGCSYFAARSMAQDAELVFCPYNYIVNPIIRSAMEVDISGSIIIFDEAHNIEDIARDAGSIDLEEEVLLRKWRSVLFFLSITVILSQIASCFKDLQTELGQLSLNDAMTYQPLFEMTEDILSWIGRRKSTLVKREFQRYFRWLVIRKFTDLFILLVLSVATLVGRIWSNLTSWTGDKALKELQEANLSPQSFSILQECAKKAIKAASEAEPDFAHLSGMAATTLEGLFSSLNYFFFENGVHASDYELALQRFVKKDEGLLLRLAASVSNFCSRNAYCVIYLENAAGGWTITLNLWCLNPAVVFKGIAEVSQSVILTSGTLSPLNTFSSELGVQFGTCLEAPHVIDVDSQVWAAAIANGPGNYPLNASYKTADEYAFQDAVGTSLEEICKVVPGGCLVFFPSYKLLDKVSTRWQETGQWSRLNAQKSFFVESRGGNQESFEAVLKGYYNSICQGTGQMTGRKIRGKKLGLKNGNSVESPKYSKKEGAAFLAVCRGKVSEGMDFSDDNARVVVSFHILFVIVGIPFPNIYDIKVAQKKKFNDTYELSKKLLSGNEWYCQQAFRALNQATGNRKGSKLIEVIGGFSLVIKLKSRCIRHRFDYGAIIFLDERFHKDRNRAYISKWLRNSIRLYSCFEESLDGLKSFFRDVKDRVGKASNSSQNLDVDCENIKPVEKKIGTRKKSNKVTKSSRYQQKVESNDILVGEKAAGLIHPAVRGAKYDSLSTQTRTEVVLLTDDKDSSVCREYIDLECDSDKDSRWSSTPLVALSRDNFELTFVKETPGMNFSSPKTTQFFSNNDYSSPRTNHQLTALPQQHPIQPTSVINLHAGPTNIMCSALTTPEKGITAQESSIEPEAESSWSVNSNAWKRRKFTALSSVGPRYEYNTPVPISDRFSPLASSITTSNATHRTEEMNHSNNECGKFNSSLSSTPINFDGSQVPSGVMDERLQISCSRCKNPLGLPENDSYVVCSRISTSKVHLMSLWKKTSETVVSCTSSVDVLVSNTSSVNQRLCGTARESASGQGIWCKEDGCVFNTIFCPFCFDAENSLGVHVVATDASNIKFQNKMLLYLDRLEIKNFEATKDEDLSPHGDHSSMVKDIGPSAFEKFAYISPVQDSGGWRNTKSRSSYEPAVRACSRNGSRLNKSDNLKWLTLCGMNILCILVLHAMMLYQVCPNLDSSLIRCLSLAAAVALTDMTVHNIIVIDERVVSQSLAIEK